MLKYYIWILLDIVYRVTGRRLSNKLYPKYLGKYYSFKQIKLIDKYTREIEKKYAKT